MSDLWEHSYQTAMTVVSICAGRADGLGKNYPYLADMVARAGGGNHVDIGVRFGHSAVLAALTKKLLKHGGTVYGVDPLIPGKRPEGQREVAEWACPGPEVLEANAKAFGVKVELVRELSNPWPEQLKDVQFSTAMLMRTTGIRDRGLTSSIFHRVWIGSLLLTTMSQRFPRWFLLFIGR